VLRADCREILAELPERCVDHVFADPPYSVAVHEGIKAAIRNELPDVTSSDCRSRRMVDFGFEALGARDRRLLARLYARVVRRWVGVFSDLESSHLWRLSLGAAGLPYVRTPLWVREGGAPQFSGDRPAVAAECITTAHRKGRKRWNGGGKAGLYAVPIVMNRGGARDSREHTTQKPEELMLGLVADYTEPDELILDSHAGSGTTGVAAVRLGRRAILIEQKAHYAEVARERLRAEESNQSLSAARAKQLPMFGAK
jgi:DNA modification methylase